MGKMTMPSTQSYVFEWFFGSRHDKKPEPAATTPPTAPEQMPSVRRNVCVNHALPAMEADHYGESRVCYVGKK
ncbi:uncharacterized protein LACBIDRAFT_300345 [Laccaria bicolor S238N-H82]|uniref:Predicted protein n=1 Tax=Laccaria bicolor (strain S238N-H82 / ATCC MYA-4686) TaxID=486041 RepID=B0DGJ4_LACBS|nr:uncharacterized protein LACBIDRAFT_300345 [Laccaria bicolor S238N-H82]EDR06164.1 predicted protein [Laccaria bicolor S238N-H82]|eukprot:XP_001883025.1 predicted protein [Laccaria bicolor S238N-H82]